eukprot:TRINITY_DN10517_c0_g1_i1.p1 TRINITY_DN10517_c0_g1~~TRINITY_DN10517_c0_g1_i1.p1  ORF type:complete len:741 (-),score=159.42 TRINITY_DN10517_c0_g1_i1:66-2288(-)
MRKLQKGVLLACIFDIVTIGLYFGMGSNNESAFIQKDIIHFHFTHSLIDLTVLAFVKGLFLSIGYVCFTNSSVAPIFISSTVVSFYIALKVSFFAFGDLSDPHPMHYILPGYMFIVSWGQAILGSYNKKKDMKFPILIDHDRDMWYPERRVNNSNNNSNSKNGLSRNNPSMNAVPLLLDAEEPPIEIETPIKRRRNTVQAEKVPVLDTPQKEESEILPSIPRLVALMTDKDTGIELKDRTHLFITYTSCFTGSSAVDWVMKTLNQKSLNRKRAKRILQEVMDRGYIEDIQKLDENEVPIFHDDNTLYRFWDPTISNLPISDLDMKVTPQFNRMHNLPKSLLDIYTEMRSGRGIPYRERHIETEMGSSSVLPASFRGNDAVNWLMNKRMSPEFKRIHGTMFFQSLLNLTLIYPLSRYDTTSFVDDNLFYRYNEDDDNLPIFMQKHPIEEPLHREIHIDSINNLIELLYRNNVPMEHSSESIEPISIDNEIDELSDSTSEEKVKIEKPKVPESPQVELPPTPIKRSALPRSLSNFISQMKSDEDGVYLHTREIDGREYDCFSGKEAISWLVKKKDLQYREHAVKMLDRLLQLLYIFPVTCEINISFRDDNTIYAFAKEDEIVYSPMKARPELRPPRKSTATIQKRNSSKTRGSLMNFITEMKSEIPIALRKIKRGNETQVFHNSFVGSEAVSWIMAKQNLIARAHGTKLMQKLIDNDVIESVEGSAIFQDRDDAFYRFLSVQ